MIAYRIIYVASTSVDLVGPPLVITSTISAAFIAPATLSMTTTEIIGIISGIVIFTAR
ncbi:hypothetical protein D3C76_1748580 [compost metagenome]